jgi:hypothetical protein
VNALLAAIVAIVVLTLIKSTPLIYAALGGVISERSGVVNIGLEGMMIAGAFTSVAVSGATGSPILGTMAGIVAGALLAALLAYGATKLGVDQIVAGTGLNIAALAAAAFGIVLVFHQPGASHEVPAFGHTGDTLLIVLAFVLAGVLHVVLTRTPWGLHVRACGEDPSAAEAAGIDALYCGRDQRRDRLARRRVPRARRIGSVLRRHDGRTRFHRTRRGDLRALDAAGRDRSGRLLRLLRGAAIVAPTRGHPERVDASAPVHRSRRRAGRIRGPRACPGGRRSAVHPGLAARPLTFPALRRYYQ